MSGTRAATATHTDTMAAAVAPGSLEAKVASLEAQLASVRAQADADAINAEHLSQAMETRYAALAEEHLKVRSGIFRDVFVTSARPIRCSRGASARSTFGSPRPRRRTLSSDSTKLQCRAFKNSPPHPPPPPSLQAVSERDAIKAQLSTAQDELAAAKSQTHALDVSIVKHTASADRLKVREISAAGRSPRP